MGCLYCGSEIQPIRRLQDPDFCSAAHRRHYHDKLRNALNRLNEPDPVPARTAAPLRYLAPVDAGSVLSSSGQFFRHTLPRARPAGLAVGLAPLPGRSFVTSGQIVPRAAPPETCEKTSAGAVRITPETAQHLRITLPRIEWNSRLAPPESAAPRPASTRPLTRSAAPLLGFRGTIELGDGLPAARIDPARLPEAVRPWRAQIPVPSSGNSVKLRDSGGWTRFPAAPVSGPKLLLACLADFAPEASGDPDGATARIVKGGPVWPAFGQPAPATPAAPPVPAHLTAAATLALPGFTLAGGERPALPESGAAAAQFAPQRPVPRPLAGQAAQVPAPGMRLPEIRGVAAVEPQGMPETQRFRELRVESAVLISCVPAAVSAEPANLASPAARLPGIPAEVAVAGGTPRLAGFASGKRPASSAANGERVRESAPHMLPASPAIRPAALQPRSGKGFCPKFARFRVHAAHQSASAVEPAVAAPCTPALPASLPAFPHDLGLSASAAPKAMAAPWMAAFAPCPPAVAPVPLREPSAEAEPLCPAPAAAIPFEPVPADTPCMSAAATPAHLALFWRNAPAELSRSGHFLATGLGFHLPGFNIAPVLEPLELPAEPAPEEQQANGRVLQMPARDAARRRRQHAIAQKAMAMAASILAAVALWFGGGHVTVARALTGGQWLRQALAERASTEDREDFRTGMKAWAGNGQGWDKSWSRDPEGYVRPGQFALFKPSLAKTDYRMEMLAQIERKSLAWAVRARDPENYYAVKLTVTKPGPRPLVSLVRYAVIGGKRGKATEVPVRVTLPTDAPYRVAVDVSGRKFAASIDGQPVDNWTDDILPAGGVAMYSEAGERARLYWMRVVSNDDLLGRICAMLAGKDGKQEARLDDGPRRLSAGMAGRFSPLPAMAFLPHQDY